MSDISLGDMNAQHKKFNQMNGADIAALNSNYND